MKIALWIFWIVLSSQALAQCGATITPTDPSSCTSADGSIYFTIPTGTPPFFYSIDNGATFIDPGVPPNYTFTGLGPGTYTTIVQDGGGCQSVVDITLSGGTAISYTVAITNSSCTSNDGVITINASGGSNYTYSIDNGVSFQASNTFNNLSAGNYNLVVLDATGCEAIGNETVNNTSNLAIQNINSVDNACPNGNDGTLTINTTGGSGTLQYSIDNGITYSNSNVFNSLPAGTYDCLVLDGAGCSVASSVTIYDPAVLTPEITAWMLNNTGHLADYTTNTTGYVQTTDSSDVKTVCYDNNDVYVRANGMASYTMGAFPNNPNIPVNQDWTFKIPRNPAEETGAKTETPFGGALGLAINGATLFGYGDGMTYNNNGIWVQDAWVSEGATMDASGNGHPAPGGIYHYHANPIALYSQTNNGHSPIVGYALDGYPIYGPFGYTDPNDPNSAVIRMESSYELRNITVRTTLPNGTASNPAGPAVSNQFPLGTYIQDYEFTGSGTLDQYNGRFTITPEYPAGTYAYFMTTDLTGNPAFPYLLASEYYGEVSFADIANAGGSNQPGGLTCWDGNAISAVAYSSQVYNAACGNSDGSLTITATGGDNSSYTYSIDNGTPQSSNIFTGLTAGSYLITVTDGSGCSITGTEVVSNTASPTVTSQSSTNTSCFGVSNGLIIVTASGGTGSLNYSIDNGLTFQNNGTFNGLSVGNYTILIEDQNGCQEFASFTINTPDAITVSTSNSVNATCSASNGSISIVAVGGSNGIQYSIDNGQTFQNNGNFNNLIAGSYTILIEDGNGCQNSTTVNVNNDLAPTIDNQSSTDALCNGQNDGSILVNASGGTGALSYSIDNGITTQNNGSFSGLPAGFYTVLIEDANGCVVSTGVNVNEPSLISIGGAITNELNGNDGAIDLTVTGGNPQYIFDWDNDGLGDMDDQEDLTGLSSGSYTVYVYDNNNCVMDTTFFVDQDLGLDQWLQSISLYPNPATDQLFIQSEDSLPFDYKIFDLSGKMVLDGTTYKTIEIRNLATGSYMIEIRQNGNILNSRIIKN